MSTEWLQKYKILPGMKVLRGPTNILLRHHRMPGDILTMTPLVRDIKITYGDFAKLKVDTPQGQEIWQNSPHLSRAAEFEPDMILNLDYKIAAKNDDRGLNMAEGFRQDFMRQSGLHLNASTMWPDIYMSEEEIESFGGKFPELKKFGYWIICPGNKASCRIKVWPRKRWQDLVRAWPSIPFVQIGQSRHGHEHLRQKNVLDMIDRTPSLRDLFLLFYFSRGSIGYNSLHMHVSAAFRKPCIVLGGAREPSSLTKYPNHQYFSTMGLVSCGKYHGCFKARKLVLNRYRGEVGDLCPDDERCKISGQIFPACMNIPVNQVLHALKKYEAMIARGEYDLEYADCVIEKTEDARSTIDNQVKVDRKEVMPRGKGINSKGIFRLLCNTRWFGGGERTAIRLAELMIDEGYEVHVVSLDKGSSALFETSEFASAMPNGAVIIPPSAKDKCDITLFHVNDSIVALYSKDRDSVTKINLDEEPKRHPVVDHHFALAKRKILSVNYHVWGLGHYADSDIYVCQNHKLADDLAKLGISITKIRILWPPAEIRPYLRKTYARDYGKLRLIRYSSQGDRKYSDDIQTQLSRIYAVRNDMEIHLMPPPTYLQDGRVHVYMYNAMKPLNYLGLGNVFWYWVPEEKFVESAPNAVIEAMASGLPVLCNDNGGLSEMVNDKVGWLCKNEKEMYSAIAMMDMSEIRAKGEKARQKAKEMVRPDLWVRLITGSGGETV